MGMTRNIRLACQNGGCLPKALPTYYGCPLCIVTQSANRLICQVHLLVREGTISFFIFIPCLSVQEPCARSQETDDSKDHLC
jgi:hypothetical protein